MKKITAFAIITVLLMSLVFIPCSAAAKYGNNYAEKVTQVFSFNDRSDNRLNYASGLSADSSDSKEGGSCLSYRTSSDGEVLLMESKADSGLKFSASDRKSASLRLWVYISDISLLHVDDSDDDDKTQGTVYIKVASNAYGSSKAFSWRHTVSKSGWQEFELPFYHGDDWEDSDFDVSNICYFSVRIKAASGLTFKMDNLRIVQKSADYTENPAPENCTLLTNCDYNEFRSEIFNWRGASYDTADKAEGSSSYRLDGKSTSDEYRMTLSWSANEMIPARMASDTLHLSVKVNGISDLRQLYIQMRFGPKTKDSEKGNGKYLTYLIPLGSLTEGNWMDLEIPLTKFQSHNDADENTDYSMYLFRIVPYGASAESEYTVKLDRIYLYRNSDFRDVSALLASHLAEIAASDAAEASDAALSDASGSGSNGSFNPMIFVIIAVAVLAVIAVVLVLVLSKKKPGPGPEAGDSPKDAPPEPEDGKTDETSSEGDTPDKE